MLPNALLPAEWKAQSPRPPFTSGGAACLLRPRSPRLGLGRTKAKLEGREKERYVPPTKIKP